MAAPTLVTLNDDIVYELLIQTTSLRSLRCLLLVHPLFYRVFCNHRRLILRKVYASQTVVNYPIYKGYEFVKRCRFVHAIDRVALREVLWLRTKRAVPNKLAMAQACAMLSAYHTANLKEEALDFASRTIRAVQDGYKPEFQRDIRTFALAVVRKFSNAGRFAEALEVQRGLRERLVPQAPDHSAWSHDILGTYLKIGDTAAAMQFRFDTWDLYRTALGAGSATAMDWARMIVRQYQIEGDDDAAIEFHSRVRGLLDPTTSTYISWARQLVRMYHQQQREADELAVIEDVWRHLNLNSHGYRAWTTELASKYQKMGQKDKAVLVLETVYTAIRERMESQTGRPDEIWKYHERGIAFSLTQAYKQNGRPDLAIPLQAQYASE